MCPIRSPFTHHAARPCARVRAGARRNPRRGAAGAGAPDRTDRARRTSGRTGMAAGSHIAAHHVLARVPRDADTTHRDPSGVRRRVLLRGGLVLRYRPVWHPRQFALSRSMEW